MIKLDMQDYGSLIKLFLYSDNYKEIKGQYFSFWNWKCTDGDLYCLNDTNKEFVYYIWTTKRKLINYFYNVLEHKYFLKTGREVGGPLFIRKLKEQATKRFQSIKRQEVEFKKPRYWGDFNWKCPVEYIQYS